MASTGTVGWLVTGALALATGLALGYGALPGLDTLEQATDLSDGDSDNPRFEYAYANRTGAMGPGACYETAGGEEICATPGEEPGVRWQLEIAQPAVQANLTLTWDADSEATHELTMRFETNETTYRASGSSPLTLLVGEQLAPGDYEVTVWASPDASVQVYAEEQLTLNATFVRLAG